MERYWPGCLTRPLHSVVSVSHAVNTMLPCKSVNRHPTDRSLRGPTTSYATSTLNGLSKLTTADGWLSADKTRTDST